MGADLISTFLWFRTEERPVTAEMVAHARAGYTTYPVPLLDWDAGHAAIDRLVAGWSDDDLDATDYEDRDAAARHLHAELDKLRNTVIVGDREVDGRYFKNFGCVFTGGPSFGDSPTEAYDKFTQWTDDEKVPGGGAVLDAVGFITDIYDRLELP